MGERNTDISQHRDELAFKKSMKEITEDATEASNIACEISDYFAKDSVLMLPIIFQSVFQEIRNVRSRLFYDKTLLFPKQEEDSNVPEEECKIIAFHPSTDWFAVYHRECHDKSSENIFIIKISGWATYNTGIIKGMIISSSQLRPADESGNFFTYVHEKDIESLKDKWKDEM